MWYESASWRSDQGVMWDLFKQLKCSKWGAGVLGESLGRTQKLDTPSDGDCHKEIFDGEGKKPGDQNKTNKPWEAAEQRELYEGQCQQCWLAFTLFPRRLT